MGSNSPFPQSHLAAAAEMCPAAALTSLRKLWHGEDMGITTCSLPATISSTSQGMLGGWGWLQSPHTSSSAISLSLR